MLSNRSDTSTHKPQTQRTANRMRLSERKPLDNKAYHIRADSQYDCTAPEQTPCKFLWSCFAVRSEYCDWNGLFAQKSSYCLGHSSTHFHRFWLKFEKKNLIFSRNIHFYEYFFVGKRNALAGNRTRAARVAGEHSTTEPPVLLHKPPSRHKPLHGIAYFNKISYDYKNRFLF